MVRGRLPRESNPVPGQSQPGFVPAFDETGNEDYVRVSNQKPYPVANYTQNPSGVWLPTSQNNPMPTQLTGSIIEDDDPIPTYLKSRFRVETKTPIPFSELSEGSIKVLRYRDLDPSAKKRYIVINTTINTLLKSASYIPYFREFGEIHLVSDSVSLKIPTHVYTAGKGSVAVSTDEGLSVNSDGARIHLSTNEAPTSGEVIISIVEVY